MKLLFSFGLAIENVEKLIAEAIYFAVSFAQFIMEGCNGYVNLLKVTENFYRLSRTAKRFKILSPDFEFLQCHIAMLKTRNAHVLNVQTQ